MYELGVVYRNIQRTDAATADAATADVTILDGFALAETRDDAEVRALLRRSVMPGAVHVAFTREPDYFAGEGLAGAVDRTLVHRRDARLDGVARLRQRRRHRLDADRSAVIIT